MNIGLAVAAGIVTVVAIVRVVRGADEDQCRKPDMGSVSAQWVAEYRAGSIK